MKDQKHKIKLGVDLGTTHTIVVRADKKDLPILQPSYAYNGKRLGSQMTPTAATFYQDKFYFGPAAVACFMDRFEDGAVFFGSIKRLLNEWREGAVIEMEGKRFPIDELLTAYLSELRQAVLKALRLKDAEIEAVIAVPANASSSQRYVTLDCFAKAGFQVLRILDEPTASGLQYVHERYKRWDRVDAEAIIYDLGGGTFDACLISIEKGRCNPIMSLGVNRLGGDDFDEILLDLCQREYGRELTGREKALMLGRARKVKESMGPYTQKLTLDFGDREVSVSVKDYLEALEPLLDRTVELTERLSDRADESGGACRIVMVGGGSLLPLTAKKIREKFGRSRVHQGSRPFASVAAGCAMEAGAHGLQAVDRLGNHFGVMRVREDRGEYIDVIFEKGTLLPEKGQALKATRGPYAPWHNIGRFQYLEFNDLDQDNGLVRGDRLDWNEIIFPFDREITSSGLSLAELASRPVVSTFQLEAERIIEEYYLDSAGIITVRISRTVQDDFSNCYNLFCAY